MGVTRFSGPAVGAYVTLHSMLPPIVNSETDYFQYHFPVGSSFEVTDVKVFCGTVTSDPLVTVGDTATGTQIVASVALATGANALTIKDGTIDAAGLVEVRIVADSGDAIAAPVAITVGGYYTSVPTSVAGRGRS